MSDWLTPVREVLGAAGEPVDIFFRDDDAGWDDDSLFHLLDLFSAARVPIDLAVIPQALEHALAAELVSRGERTPDLLGLHQHGFAHTNHEESGRKHEFGPSRSRDQQLTDINSGQRRLAELLGEAVDPVFTPPWNRCTETTVDCLHELGFQALSRDITATRLPLRGLQELPVAVDWLRVYKGERMTKPEIARSIVDRVQAADTTGIMLHHAAMNDEDFADVGELLELFGEHENASCRLMRKLMSKTPK